MQSQQEPASSFTPVHTLSSSAVSSFHPHPTARIYLLYFNFRGILQPVRNLLAYLNLPYIPVYLQQHKQILLSEEFIVALNNHTIEAGQPQLLHQGRSIVQMYPMLSYLARRFGRIDLLGRDIYQRSQFQQVLHRIVQKLPNSLSLILNLINGCSQLQLSQVSKRKLKTYQNLIQTSNYIMQMSLLVQANLNKQNSQGFVLGTLTILDFFFYQTCFHVCNVFGDLDSKITCPFNRAFKKFFDWNCNQQRDPLQLIDVMRQFKKRFEQMYFVVANKEYLEGFSICCPSADSLMVEGYRRIWVGDQKFIKNGKDASGLSRMAYGGRPIIR